MKYITTAALAAAALLVSAAQASELTAAQIISPLTNPDYCINSMAGFPSDNFEARYQFFHLTKEMARDMTPEYRAALAHYSAEAVPAQTPVLDVIEDIANPVLRQAAPDITIANMAYVTDFAAICAPFISGQIDSLIAYDSALGDAEFNAVIAEDALFLRQILSDSLYRLGADRDPAHAAATAEYARALIITRDAVEFSTFDAEVDDLEILFMTDLDGRLKRSNDMINAEMDREVLGDAVQLSDSLSDAAKERAKQERIYTLIRILGRG